jgi:hypothetical protein
MSKKKTKLKRFEVFVPTTSYTVFRVESVDEEQAIELVLSGELESYEVIEETLDPDSNNYMAQEVQ